MIVSRLARFTASLAYETLPDAVRHAAKRCLLDWLGAAISGSPVPPATLMTAALADELGHGRARLVPSGTSAPLRTAALINGTAAHAMEVDDIFRDGVYHPGPPVIAATLAAAQHRGASGADLLTAIVAGYEASNPVAAAMQPAHYDFWHTTGTVGTIGAAAGAARALGLDAEKTGHAIGNAITMAAALQQAFLADAMAKPLHTGHAAEAGATAALIASEGVTGAPGMLEGERGFGAAMSRDVDWDAAVAKLGEDFTIARMTQKNHTCCGHSFAGIDATLYLRQHENLKADDVKSITVASYAKAVEICGNPDPKTVYETKFSLPYSVAVALVTGAARFDAFSDARLADPATRALMAKVTVILDDTAEAAFPGRRSATVTVVTTDGRRLERYAPTRKGDPDDPLSDQELEAKYRNLAAPVIGDEAAARFAETIWQVEGQPAIGELGVVSSGN